MADPGQGCPFCGGHELTVEREDAVIRVICLNPDCGAKGPRGKTENEAAAIWDFQWARVEAAWREHKLAAQMHPELEKELEAALAGGHGLWELPSGSSGLRFAPVDPSDSLLESRRKQLGMGFVGTGLGVPQLILGGLAIGTGILPVLIAAEGALLVVGGLMGFYYATESDEKRAERAAAKLQQPSNPEGNQ